MVKRGGAVIGVVAVVLAGAAVVGLTGCTFGARAPARAVTTGASGPAPSSSTQATSTGHLLTCPTAAPRRNTSGVFQLGLPEGSASRFVPFAPSGVLLCRYGPGAPRGLKQSRLVTSAQVAETLAAALNRAGKPWPQTAISCPAALGTVVWADFWSGTEQIAVNIETSGCTGGSNGLDNRRAVFDGAVAQQLNTLVGAGWGH
jgi:hypothetical protein